MPPAVKARADHTHGASLQFGAHTPQYACACKDCVSKGTYYPILKKNHSFTGLYVIRSATGKIREAAQDCTVITGVITGTAAGKKIQGSLSGPPGF